MAVLPSIKIKKPKRSLFNRDKKVRLTATPGLGYPVICEYTLPGDSLEFDMGALIKTHAALSPVFGSFKVQFDMFWSAARNYVPEMRNNPVGTDYSDIAFPTFSFSGANYSSNAQHTLDFNPDTTVPFRSRYNMMAPTPFTLEQYFGVPVGYYNSEFATRKFNALGLLTYWDVYLNYYINPQDPVCYYYRSEVSPGIGSDWLTPLDIPALMPLQVSVIQNQMNDWKSTYGGYDVMRVDAAVVADLGTASENVGADGENMWMRYPFVRTYLPDYFTATLNKANVDSMVLNSAIDVSSGNLTMDQFIVGSRIYKMFARGIAAGERYAEWIRAQFGVTPASDMTIPQYLGSKSIYLSFDDVVSTSNTKSEDSTDITGLGELAGRGHAIGNGRKHYFNFNDHGVFMVIMSIVPQVAYNQGINKFALKTRMSDVFVPALDSIGYQDVFREEFSAQPWFDDSYFAETDNGFPAESLFKQPAWIEYMTNHDQNFGLFATDLDYWVLNRDYSYVRKTGEEDIGLDQPLDKYKTIYFFTSYIDPSHWNKQFVDQAVDANNFQVEMYTSQLWKRCISKQMMPTL